MTLLKGFGFSGYRSFGDQLIKIAPLKKVNLIIGQNNSGKSNIVNFLADHYPFFLKKVKAGSDTTVRITHGAGFNDIDYHKSDNSASHRISFPILQGEFDNYVDKLLREHAGHGDIRDRLIQLLTCDSFCDSDGNIWFTYKANSSVAGAWSLEVELDNIKPIFNSSEWSQLWSVLTKQRNGNLNEHWIPQTINYIAFKPDSAPDVVIIPAIRKVGSSGSEATDYSGKGIIERLAKIQNPSHAEQELKKKFYSINAFVKTVLENSSAEIEIPFARDMLLVHMDGKTLPLDSLGTGVHEVVIIASAATLLNKTILCVEEPELHLHPLLQRKLVKYLSENTDNQYFFTTHSAHLLDAVDAEIFHVTHVDGASRVDAIASTKERSNICHDLGYKASDILQANCIIWVEGPSDRIYLNYWLKVKRPDLVEGIHYSIMFYGGRLFSHLTASDVDELQEQVEDFVSVRNLNRNSVIMFDSDKSKPRAHLNQTKKRLKAEFDKGPGFTWVTKGREVENYLNNDQVEHIVMTVHPTAEKLLEKGDWANLLKYEKKKKRKLKNEKVPTANKVKVARAYVEKYQPDFGVLDLNNQLNHLCSFIDYANGNES